MTPDRLALCLGRISSIGLTSKTAPDFDEIIDTNEDLTAAARTDHAFQALHSLFGTWPPPEHLEATFKLLLSPAGQSMLEEHNKTLNEVSEHFDARLRDKGSPTTIFTIGQGAT